MRLRSARLGRNHETGREVAARVFTGRGLDMRNMSFALTTEQVLKGTKTVTRRLGWALLEPGERVQGVEKGQGLKKGEKVRRLRVIRARGVRLEALECMTADEAYGRRECAREGFPHLSPAEFVAMFCRANKCKPQTTVTRIEFEYV